MWIGDIKHKTHLTIFLKNCQSRTSFLPIKINNVELQFNNGIYWDQQFTYIPSSRANFHVDKMNNFLKK